MAPLRGRALYIRKRKRGGGPVGSLIGKAIGTFASFIPKFAKAGVATWKAAAPAIKTFVPKAAKFAAKTAPKAIAFGKKVIPKAVAIGKAVAPLASAANDLYTGIKNKKLTVGEGPTGRIN